MGLDARIYIGGAVPLSDAYRADIGDCLSHWAPNKEIFTGMTEGWTWIEGYERYFSEAYDRGFWPGIRKALTRTLEEFRDKEVRYGADSDVAPDWAALVTPVLLAQLDQAWEDHVARNPGRYEGRAIPG